MMKVHEIGNYMLRNYLIETDAGFIAIDTGYPGGMARFVRRFEGIAPLPELKYIFLTHAHDDHAGFLSALLDATNAQVILSPLAIPALTAGRSIEAPGGGYSGRLASMFSLFKKEFRFPPVDVTGRARFIETELDQPFRALNLPLKILLLPGHTVDSIGLMDEESGALFAGDAAMNAIISPKRHTI